MSTVGRNLAWLNSPFVQRSLATSSFDPVELARDKMILYLILPPDKLESHNRLLRVWLTSWTRALVRNGLQERNRVLFMLDEVCTFRDFLLLSQ
jgi:type IV secretion system protein VirD4